MKKWFLIVFAMLSVAFEGVQAQTTGSCGTGLTWTFSSESGSLYISGNGAINDRVSSWNDIRSAVTSITMDPGITAIGDRAFNNFVNLASVSLPANLQSIRSRAFYNCSHLQSITIPQQVVAIGSEAFSGCTSLSSIIFAGTNISSVGTNAFFGTPWKTNLPNGLNYIGKVLYSCKGELPVNATVNIPDGVVAIADSAFSRCINLESVTIPNSVRSIGFFAFLNCYALKTVTLPNELTCISIGVFCNCENLTSISIPTTVTTIQIFAFENCSKLSSIDIPDGVSYIGENAFCGCDALTSLRLPASLKRILSGSFMDCSSLTSVVIQDSVVEIGRSAFYYCEKLTNIQFPPSVSSIDQDAFFSTAWLNNLPNGIVYIGKVLFLYKMDESGSMPQNTAIVVPEGIESIATFAFYGCHNLASIQFPSTLKTIGREAFIYCSGLKSVYLPNGLTLLDARAFKNCSSLTGITLPVSLLKIGAGAFENCTGLTSLVIPEGVEYINYRLVKGCTNLTKCTIPKTALDVSIEVFMDCYALKEIVCANPTPPILHTGIGFDPFDVSTCTLKVPVGSKSAYEGAWGWNAFGSIVEEAISADPAVSTVPVSVTASTEGIRISGCKPDDEISIYALSGNCVFRAPAGTGLLQPTLNAGAVYLLKTPYKTFKLVCVR